MEREIHNLKDTICTLRPPMREGTQREDVLRIEVRRGFLLADALKEGRKNRFDPLKLLKVSTFLLQTSTKQQLHVQLFLFICVFA